MTRPEPAEELTKQAVRDTTWAALAASGDARFPGTVGRIPNFVGAEAAAARLASTPEWAAARTIKANPDSPQLPVRARALADGKTVFMAVPKLADEQPFLMLDPELLDVKPRAAASIKGSGRYGVPVAPDEVGHIDLIVCGTVAVGASGERVGKGGGYSDLEFALGQEFGFVTVDTVIATTVHPVQVHDVALPMTSHDFFLDLVVTPFDVVRHPPRSRPTGIIWDDLDADKIGSIPALRELQTSQ